MKCESIDTALFVFACMLLEKSRTEGQNSAVLAVNGIGLTHRWRRLSAPMKYKTYFSLVLAGFSAVVLVSCARPPIIGSNTVLPGTTRQTYNGKHIIGTNFRKRIGDADFGITIRSDKPAENITTELRNEGDILKKVSIKPGDNANFQYQVRDAQIGHSNGAELMYTLDGNSMHTVGTVASYIRDKQEITITMVLQSKNILSQSQIKEAHEEWDKVVVQNSN